MLKTQIQRIALSTATFITALFLASSVSAAGSGRFEVTITNLTQSQIISPAVVTSHARDAAPLFVLGEPASPELATLAEDATRDDLIEQLHSSPDVLDIQTLFGMGGPIMPGETASVVVESLGNYRYISLVVMLVSTNDAFIGINGVRAHPVNKVVQMVPAYDADSEANTEHCDHIPGPPCGNPEVRVTEGAEGYIYIHPGVSGKSSDEGLDESVHDLAKPGCPHLHYEREAVS